MRPRDYRGHMGGKGGWRADNGTYSASCVSG